MVYQSRFRNDPDLEDLYARQRAATYRSGRAQIKEQQGQAVEAAQSDPMRGALTGAGIGGMFGPIGMAIGAGAGLLAGGAKDVAARRKAGEGWGSALGHTVVDAHNPANLLRGGNAMKAASVAARGKGFAGGPSRSNFENVDLSGGAMGGEGGPQGEFGSFGEESSYWDSRVAEANNELADAYADKWGREMGESDEPVALDTGDFSDPTKKWPWEDDEELG